MTLVCVTVCVCVCVSAQFLRSTLNRQPCERLLTSPHRHLLHEAPVTLLGTFVRLPSVCTVIRSTTDASIGLPALQPVKVKKR